MPSPFPGMDPYLEGDEWSGVQFLLSSQLSRQLADRLPLPYVVRANYWYPTEMVGDDHPGPARKVPGSDRPRHVIVEVKVARSGRLVATLEVLSPATKVGAGRDEYLARRRQALASDSHLVEIDLLRAGQRLPMSQPLPSASYFVLMSRADQQPSADVWPVALADRLPVVSVPLLAGDADVPLDLQAALTAVYDTFHYERSVDYSKPPEVPLSPVDAEWAAKLLAATAVNPTN